jgi:hypothetical protein
MGCLTDAARKQYPPDTGNIQEYFINAEKFFATILSLGSFNLKISASMAENTFLSNFCKSFWVIFLIPSIKKTTFLGF